MLVFLGSLVGLKLPGLFSGGPLSICVHMVAAGLAAANLLVRGVAVFFITPVSLIGHWCAC
jgi:hypothetical protein